MYFNILDKLFLFFQNLIFSMQTNDVVTPADRYAGVQSHMSQGMSDKLAMIIIVGSIIVVFITFLIIEYIKIKKKPRY